MQITDLPNDILLKITRQINTKYIFNFAIVCKQLYERIRHLPLDTSYNLENLTNVGTFFLTTTKEINLILNVNDINYRQIQAKLCSFYYIQTLNILTDQAISVPIALNLLNCIPSFFSASLSLKISDNSYHSFSQALKKCKRYGLKIITDTQTVGLIMKKRRTPSPIREAERSVKKMKEWWLQQNNDKEPANMIPHALNDEKLISSTSKYVEFESNNSFMDKAIKSSTEVSRVIKDNLAPLFVESCIKFGFSFVFVTQFEVYYRNEEKIDASATPTVHDPYYEMPVGVIRDKNEKGKTWFELSIFYKRYEILVTGGILGQTGSSQLSPFLGPSIPFSNLTSKEKKTTDSIIISLNRKPCLLRERNLRNWSKPSSSFKWAVVSKRFADKGFMTINPLFITDSRNKTINLISFVLYCISRNSITENDHKKMLSLLAEVHIQNITPRTSIKSVASFRKKIVKNAPSYNLTLINALVNIEKNIGKAPTNFLKVETVVTLSSKVYAYAKSVNKKALNFYKF